MAAGAISWPVVSSTQFEESRVSCKDESKHDWFDETRSVVIDFIWKKSYAK